MASQRLDGGLNSEPDEHGKIFIDYSAGERTTDPSRDAVFQAPEMSKWEEPNTW